MFEFDIQGTDGYARAGTFTTPHGDIQTPVFMPVGTNATVKGVTREQLEQIGTQIMLSNTYHLYLRPGPDIIEEFGGLHEFMNVDMPILTDSGGFQVFSLGNPRNGGKSLVKIDENGVEFRSHLDGSKHYFTPERAMDIQAQLGADIIMAFDDVAPGNASIHRTRQALDRTHRWAHRCVEQWQKNNKKRIEQNKYEQALFPIIQGVINEKMRLESVHALRDLPTPGIAIGGLSVGESTESMYRILDVLAPELPKEKPHYLMGVGTPENLIESVARGVDMWDCVLPTRLGRHHEVYSSLGNMKLKNAKYKTSQSYIPCKDGLETYVSRNYTLGYLRHLCQTGESLGNTLLSMHNLEFLIKIGEQSRTAILSQRFDAYRTDFWKDYISKNPTS